MRATLLGSAPALSKTAGSSNLWTCRHQPISLKGEGEVQPGARRVEGVAGHRAPTCHADVVLHEPDVALGPGDVSDPGIKPESPALAGGFFATKHWGSP